MYVRRFYKNDEEFNNIYEKLKLIKCPHCNLIGLLILHGYLYGYSENNTERIKRGRRIICSNRKNKKGCGKTHSILLSTFIKHFSISANTVWNFLNKVKHGIHLFKAFKDTGSKMRVTNCYRIFKKFKKSQFSIRTNLLLITIAPQMPHTTDPAIQTINHLKFVFEMSPCPISRFQEYFQTSFF